MYQNTSLYQINDPYVGKLVNEKNMSNEGDTTFGGDTTLGLQGYK